MYFDSIMGLFHIDTLAKIMIALIGFLGAIIGLFARRYMQGDSRYYKFIGLLVTLVLFMMLMVAADNMFFLLGAWGVSNFLLIEMMIHNRNWPAAKASGWLTIKTLSVGFTALIGAFSLIYTSTGSASIQHIAHSSNTLDVSMTISILLIVIAAMSQSAIWPFHRWLVSSLNSPTPTSAIMHAGLVNGGGFLLARFAPLYFAHETILAMIFILGIVTALVGTLWKLIQNDVKRMLACSTLAQMGFMFAQCGLGLFPAAIAHLCWHSLFKANLFLTSPGSGAKKRSPMEGSLNPSNFMVACACGVLGSYVFACTSELTWLAQDTTLVLMILTGIVATQCALTLLQHLQHPLWKKCLITILFIMSISALYGYSVWLIKAFLRPLNIMQPQPLNIYYIGGTALLVLTWAVMLFKNQWIKRYSVQHFLAAAYVKVLNASQPHPSTVTANRNQYQYK